VATSAGDEDHSDEYSQCLPRLVRSLLGKVCQFVSCGTQHTMAITENTRYKKPIDQVILDGMFNAEEERRKVALNHTAKAHVTQRRRHASVELEQFVRHRVSSNAADFLKKSLERKRQTIKSSLSSPKPEVGTSCLASRRGRRPESARSSSAGLVRPASTGVSVNTVGYVSHRYRSQLRHTLQNLGLHQTQMPRWGKPAHFIPIPPQESRVGGRLSSRSSRLTHDADGDPQTSLDDRGGGPTLLADEFFQHSYDERNEATCQPPHSRPSTARPMSSKRQAREGTSCLLSSTASQGFHPPMHWNAFVRRPQ